MIAAAVAAFATTAAWAQPETCSFTAVDSQGTSGLMSYNCNLAGGYTLGDIDWSGFASTINAATFGSELRVDVSGPLGSQTLTLGSGNGYSPGAAFSGMSSAYSTSGDPAGVWTFDFYESFDDGGDALPDATWDNLDINFNEFIPPPPTCLGSDKLCEEFEGGIPASWGTVDNLGTSIFGWDTTADTGRANETGGDGFAANMDSDFYNGSPNTAPYDGSLVTPSFSIDAGNELSFNYRHRNLGSSFEAILHTSGSGDVSLVSLISASNAGGTAGDVFSLDLSAFAGETATVEFRYAGDSWDWYSQVDNVRVTPEPGTAVLLALGVVGLIRRRR